MPRMRPNHFLGGQTEGLMHEVLAYMISDCDAFSYLVSKSLNIDTSSRARNHAFKAPLSFGSLFCRISTPLSTNAILTSSTLIPSTPPSLLISLSSQSKYCTRLLTFLLKKGVGNPGSRPPSQSQALLLSPKLQLICNNCILPSSSTPALFSGNAAVKLRNEMALRFSNVFLSLSICFGIRHVYGTTLVTATTTRGVNSPHIRNTKAKMGIRFTSNQERVRSWKLERSRKPASMAWAREPLYLVSSLAWRGRQAMKLV
jgi:hypothetical protein